MTVGVIEHSMSWQPINGKFTHKDLDKVAYSRHFFGKIYVREQDAFEHALGKVSRGEREAQTVMITEVLEHR